MSNCTIRCMVILLLIIITTIICLI
jgi:hypothetical protein